MEKYSKTKELRKGENRVGYRALNWEEEKKVTQGERKDREGRKMENTKSISKNKKLFYFSLHKIIC